jgi:hypothetical protein
LLQTFQSCVRVYKSRENTNKVGVRYPTHNRGLFVTRLTHLAPFPLEHMALHEDTETTVTHTQNGGEHNYTKQYEVAHHTDALDFRLFYIKSSCMAM